MPWPMQPSVPGKRIDANDRFCAVSIPNAYCGKRTAQVPCLVGDSRYPASSKGLPLQHAQIRILSIESHPVFREGLSAIIGAQRDMLLVGQAAHAADAVSQFRKHRPDVTLMDLCLPGATGTDTVKAICDEFQGARIVILTDLDCDGHIQRALRAGASAYILKRMPKEDMLSAIRSVYDRGRCIPPEVAARIAEHMGEESLTTRELDVLRLIRDGNRNKQIADKLCIAEATVNFHIKNLVGKLQANDRTHALSIAFRRGLLEF